MLFEKIWTRIQWSLNYGRWILGLPTSGGPTEEERYAFARSLAIASAFIGISMLIRCIYTYFFTQYQDYLVTDWGAYWTRAMERYHSLANPANNNDQFSINEWILWPTMYHFILTFSFQIYNALGIDQSRWLQATLFFNCLFGSISVYYVYLLGKLLFPKSERRALAVGILYGLAYPIIYFNCTVMSENMAIPLTIMSTYYVLRFPGKFGWLLWAGLLIGLDSAVRPASIPQFLCLAAYIVFSQPGLRRKAAVIAFAIGFLIPVMGVIHENDRISKGRLHGLSSNGGLNLYMIQCNVREIHDTFNLDGGGYVYVNGMTQFDQEPDHKVVYTQVPFFQQDYFASRAFQAMERPQTWWRDLTQIPKIFFRGMFPCWGNAVGYNAIDPWYSGWFCETAYVIGLIVPPILWIVHRRRRFPWSQALLWSYMACVIVQCFFFGSERRYTYLVLFAVFLVMFTLIPTRRRSKAKAPSLPAEQVMAETGDA